MQCFHLDSGTLKKHRRTSSDSATEIKAETDYLRTARRGGGHKGTCSGLLRLLSTCELNYMYFKQSGSLHSIKYNFPFAF